MAIESINPATGELLRRYDELDDDEIVARLEIAESAFATYRLTPFSDRAKWMLNAAAILEREKTTLGALMTSEMGKTITAAIAEAEKCAAACRYYAENAESILAERPVTVDGGTATIAFQPLGVILAVMPWNFPFWQAIRFAAPALMAGNVAVLKHASNVPGCALEIERIFRDAGFPSGSFQTLLVGSDAVAGIVADRRVSAVTLTGSDAAGRAVAGAAGRSLKKSVIELGGSDPFVVMPSADLERAVGTAVTARMINNGQSCVAAKRFIIHEDVHDVFLESFVERIRQLRTGDPADARTEIGPLATPRILDDLEIQVQKSISLGAKCVVGGSRIPGPGNFFSPTVLTEIPEGSPAATEELFGPVASIFAAHNLEHAIQIANATPFGLGSSLWSNDEAEHDIFARDIEAGFVAVNGMVASDPRLPFGGVKASGYGRELGEFGIREFVNVKTIRVTNEPRR